MLPLRLVLDTNIVVSAAIKPDGLQRAVLVLAMTRPARLYISEAIFLEYRMVLQRPEFKIQKNLRLQFLQQIENISHRVHPSHRIQAADDPDDNMFLECANAARADYLVTGNLRHFPKFWKQTKIVSSREFITMITPHLMT